MIRFKYSDGVTRCAVCVFDEAPILPTRCTTGSLARRTFYLHPPPSHRAVRDRSSAANLCKQRRSLKPIFQPCNALLDRSSESCSWFMLPLRYLRWALEPYTAECSVRNSGTVKLPGLITHQCTWANQAHLVSTSTEAKTFLAVWWCRLCFLWCTCR